MSAADDVQAVIFGLGSETFALSVNTVREILDYREAFRMPHGPPWLLGLMDVRGGSVPMVDLRIRLGLPPEAGTLATRILVVDIAIATSPPLTLGLVVDRVLNVCHFAASQIEDAPEIGVRWSSDYIKGVVRQDGGFVVLLDAGHIFSSDDCDQVRPALATAA